MIWSLDSRLRRPDELGCRIVTGGDNAPQVGAFMRGRSPSHALNGCCRKACAIELAGNFMPFYFWTPTDDNPADEPSSWYGVRSLGVRQPPPSAEIDLQEWELAAPRGLKEPQVLFVLLLCSGPRRVGDIGFYIEEEAANLGLQVKAVYFDTLLDSADDLCSRLAATALQKQCDLGKFAACMASPPCSSFSAARHHKIPNGPRPLRARWAPWDPLPGLTGAELAACAKGTHLALMSLDVVMRVGRCGDWVGLEHPADRRRDNVPSIFATDEMAFAKRQLHAKVFCFDQCAYGSDSMKPTGLLCNDRNASRLERVCCHPRGHRPLLGRASGGTFCSTGAAQYPPPLCHELALLILDWLSLKVIAAPDGDDEWAAPWADRLFPHELTADRQGSHRVRGVH